MARTKQIKPVGKLRPLLPHHHNGLQVDEEGNLFNSKGTRRGMANTKTPAVAIAHKHNWNLLVIKGAISNLQHMLRNLTPTDCPAEMQKRWLQRQYLEDLERALVECVEVSREQAKKNLED